MYKALDRATNQHVAIKIMSLSESEEEDLARIQKEIDLLAGEHSCMRNTSCGNSRGWLCGFAGCSSTRF